MQCNRQWLRIERSHPAPPLRLARLARLAILLGLPWLPVAATPWRYRRLVLEPVPYGMDPDRCRRVLDVAIGIATAQLDAGTRTGAG